MAELIARTKRSGDGKSAARTRRRHGHVGGAEAIEKRNTAARTPQPQNCNSVNVRHARKSTVFGHGNFHRTGKRNVGKTIFGRMSAHLLVDFVFEVQEIRIVFD